MRRISSLLLGHVRLGTLPCSALNYSHLHIPSKRIIYFNINNKE